MKKAIIIFLILMTMLSLAACELDIVEENKIENAKTIAEKFILDGYPEIVKLTTQTLKDTTGKGRVVFMIEAEGNTDSIHNLFIVEVKRDKAELIAQLF